MLLARSRIVPLAALASAAFASACGSGKGPRKSDHVQRMALGSPVEYTLDDPDCQGLAGVESIGSHDVHMWTADGAKQTTVKVDVNGRESVSSALIEATGYGYHLRTWQTCTISDEGDFACDATKRNEVVSDVKDLRLCRTVGSYRRDSIEGATLASIAGLERAHGIYKGLAGASTLPRANLLMMPSYEDVVDATQPSTGRRVRLSAIKTDNAGFGAMADGQIYVVFPKSQEIAAKSEWKDVNLWEIPWVMAHEFSHQVFATHYTSYMTDSRSSSRAMAFGHGAGIMGKERDLTKELRAPGFGLMQETTPRKATVKDALSAVNEGFADLLAVHMLGVNENHSKNLPCFDKTRDVNDAFFADGEAKVLDKNARDVFFGFTAAEDVEGCDATDLTDAHHLGAIIAHGLTKLFATRLPADADAKTRSELLLTWIKAFDAKRKAGAAPGAEDLLVMALEAAVETAKGPTEMLSSTQCGIVKDVFPHHASDVAKGCP